MQGHTLQVNKRLLMAVMVVGAFIAILNETLLNIALPQIMHDMTISASTAQWLTTAYMLTNGVLIPVSAFLIQRFSTRKLFISAVGIFAAGTLIAAMSPDFAVLLIGRVVQASGAAIMLPLLMNVVLTIYEPHQRGAAMGMIGMVITFAPAIGPTLSGWLVEHHSWRLLFFIVLPIALLDLLFAVKSLQNVMPLSKPKVSVLSVLLSTVGFGGLLYGFSSAGTAGWGSPTVITSLVVALVALTVFVVYQLRLQAPMLEFRVFGYPMFSLTTGIMILMMMAMFSSMLLLPIYLQTMRGFTSLQSGLLVLPGAVLMGIMSPITGRIFDKIGAKLLAVVGALVTAGAMFGLAHITLHTSFVYMAVLYALVMFGMSVMMMPTMTAGLNQLPQHLNPHGTAMSNTMQQVAGAIGTALLVTVMTSETKAHLATQMRALGTSTPSQVQVAFAVRHASVLGMNDAFLVAGLISVAAFVLAWFIQRTGAHHAVFTEFEPEDLVAGDAP